MSYSHPATKQDLWVLSKFDGEFKGTFCELGAFDGLKHSNTVLLEQHGWRGTLIEAHHEFHALCEKNRKHAKCIHAAIGDGQYHTLVVGGQYTGLIEKMPSAWVKEHSKRRNQIYRVATVPLAHVIKQVDYLSLDTEGGELDILRDWLKSGGRAKVITMEFRYDKEILLQTEILCSQYGYYIDEIRGFDLCLAK